MSAGAKVESGRALRAPLRLSVDVVVVGSGAGGAMAARELARAGRSVLLVEEGSHHTSADFDQREGSMLPRLFQDSGGRATEDGAVTVLQGQGVGGSTVHNTNLCKRAPAPVLARWVAEHGLSGWSAEALAPDYQAVEEELHVTPMTADEVNRNNAVLRRGVERLGWRGGLLSHNRRGCARSGFCELGCSFNAKENALKVLVPSALSHGARVLCDVRIERVRHARVGGQARAIGVLGAVRLPDGGRGVEVNIDARAVCLGGSAVGSAALHLRSELPLSIHGGLWGGHLGGLRLHPGLAVAGRFDELIQGWQGIPQSYECTEKLSFEPGAPDRSWIVTAFAHPGGFAALQPGFGGALTAALRDYPRLAVVAAMLHDETAGEVRVSRGGRPLLRYELNDDDARALLRGAYACGEILLAAGAKEVMVPLLTPLRARTVAELQPLLAHRYRPLDPLLTAVHPMGTLPMGSDPRRSVVDPEGRHHRVQNLYVVDGSLFPTSLGGPPQITIYAAGRKVARTVAADLRRAAG